MLPDKTKAATKSAPIGNAAQKSPVKAGSKRHPTAVLRADFYYDRYYLMLITCLMLLAITGMLFLAGTYEGTIKPSSATFPTTLDGKLVAPTSLSEPGLATPALLEWAVEAITTSYTFNFIDYEKVISDANIYFTKMGYQNYRRSLIETNIVGMVQAKKYVISAVPTYAPLILKEKPTPDGTYAWQVQFPIILTFQNAKEVVKQDMIVTLLILRVPITESPTGIAIAALIARQGKMVS